MACKYKYKNNWYSEEEILNLLRKENSSFTTLYNNLIKELETSETGRKVFEQVKRDYKYKDVVDFDTTEIKDDEPTSTKEYAEIIKYAKKEGFYNEDPFSIGDFTEERVFDVNGETYKTVVYKDGSSSIGKLPKYTLEEQQEEAIVTLISILAAGKLNEKTDRNLISLLKQLLKEMSDFIRHLLRKDVIYINKDLDNISQLTDKELNKLLKDGEVTKKCN